MACSKQYYTKDGKESKLFNELRDRYGENRAEEIYLKTYTPEFKEWFGDWENSKVVSASVDENGEPRIFWHGTNQAKIQSFVQGVNYFTSDYESAKMYAGETARERGGKETLYPVFIKMEQDNLDYGEIKVLDDMVAVKHTATSNIKSLFNEGGFSSMTDNIYLSKMTPEEHAFNLRQSSDLISEPNKSGYKVAGQDTDRVSTVVDTKKALKYRGDEIGSKYADFGTKYHKIAETMIKAVTSTGVPAATILSLKTEHDLQEFEMGYVNSMKLLIENLHKQGGTILSEVRIANMGANKGKGVAGTVDIIHLRPDGFADVYDIKTAHETPWKRTKSEELNISKNPWDISDYDYYKAQRYSHQLMLYTQMLQTPDETTGRKSIQVRNVYVIPVEVYYNPDDSVRMVQMLRPENVRKWSSGKRVFAKEAKKWSENIVNGRQSKDELSGLSTASTVDDFLPKAIGIDISTVRDTDDFARSFVERHWSEKKFKLNDKIHEWKSDDKAARMAQVKEIMDSQDASGDFRITNSMVSFFNGDPNNMFNTDEDSSSTAGLRLAKIFSTARAISVKPLYEIPGFEMYEDIVMVERSDGSYDLVKFSRDRIDQSFPILHTENNIIRKFADRSGELATNSILGNRITPDQARALGITLRNSIGDYHRMRMGVIAMELASSGVKVNRIVVDGLYSQNVTTSRAIPAGEVVSQIKKMYELPNVKPLASGSLKELLDKEESYNVENYKGDPIMDLIDYMENQLEDKHFETKYGKPNARAKIQALLRQYKNDELTKDNLAFELMQNVANLRKILRMKYKDSDNIENAISSDPEFTMLAYAILDLKSVTFNPEKDITNEFFGFFSKFLKTPHATGRKTADATFDIVRQFHDNVKRETIKFLEEKKPYINELIRQSPLLKRGLAMGDLNMGGTDIVFAMGQSVFDNLFQTVVNKDGVKGRLPLLKAEGSEDFKNLTLAEQNFIRYFNKTMQKYNKNWPVGYVPLMKVSANTLLYRGKKNLTQGNIKESAKSMSNSFVRNWETMSRRGRNILDEGNDNNTIDDIFNDRFSAMLIKDKTSYYSHVLEEYGLDENMQLIDANANENFETNLEQIMTSFATHYIKKQQYDQALPAYQVMRSILRSYDMAYGLDQTNTIEMLDTYVKDLIGNIKQADDKTINAIVTAGVNSASIALLAFNVPVYVNNAIQMWSSGFIDSLTNTMTSDPRFPGIKHFSRAGTIMIQAMNPAGDMELAHRLRLMKDKYLPDDMSMLTGDRNKKTSSGLINTQLAFTMDRATEYTIRTQHLIAQMLKDGSFDAHKAVQVKGDDGIYRWELQYDPKLDKRFEGEDGKLLYERLKETQEEKGELLENGELSMAYDWRLRQRLAAYINRQIGTYDKDLGSHISRFSIAYALTQFRTWFRDAFVRSTKIEYDAAVFGNYVRKGNEVVWENDTMKGILWTMADLYTIAKKYAKHKTIEPADKRNLIFAANSTAAMFAAYVILAALWDDDEVPPGVAGSFVRFYDDTMKWATLGPYTSALTSPIVFISYYQRMFSGLIDAMSYGIDGDSQKMKNAFIRVLPKVISQNVTEED